MSAGSRPPRRVGRDVYWRRRLLLLAALIGLAWVVVKVVGLTSEDEPAPAAATTATATAAPTPTATPTPTTPPDQVTVALQTATTACKPENLRIVPSVPGGQSSGGPVAVDLMITSLDARACTFDPDADDLLVVVDTDQAPIYDSSVCRAAFFDTPVAVPAGWGTVTRVQWSGKGSGKACADGEGFAPPGTYTFKIGTYGGEPGEVTFTLAEPPAPAPTPAPTPAAPTPSQT